MTHKNPLSIATASAIVLVLGAGTGAAQQLNIYGWAGELPDEVIEAFEDETGIRVILDTFDSNEAMIARLDAGATGYDMVNPSQYAVQILIARGFLKELDHDRIEGYDNIAENFRQVSYDPGNRFALPYLWGTTGLAYNASCVDEPVTSWAALWDERFSGRIYMLDNMLAAYIAGLQVNGFSANSSDEAEIAQATESLIAQRPILAGYNSTNFADLVASGEACLVQSWSGSVLQAMETNPDVRFVLPEEGGTMWIDSYAILADAQNVDEAYTFLSFLTRPEVAAEVTERTSVATTLLMARDLLPAEIAENSAIFPDDEVLANADFILDVGEAMRFYQDGWTRVRAGQ